MKRSAFFATSLLCLSFAALFTNARADEGMWLYSNPPVKQIEEKYGVSLAPELLDALQHASLRFATYGSASFVSSNGLIMTNHHVGLRTVASLSSKERDFVRDGFIARSVEEELRCPGLQLVMLDEIVDVTQRVEDALKSAKTDAEADAARAAVFKEIEEEANAAKGLKCSVVTLYQGGLYHLYCYKEFNDVRLVFAPEESVGFFGGDPDNFEYPRYNLDVAFFRAYEDEKPYRPKAFLKWSENGAAEGELVLVSGHPARTNRFNTVADLQFQRDVYYPHMMNKYRRREVAYQIFASYGEENARRIATDLFGVQNSRKNRGGILQGLQNASLMQKKIDAENELRRLAQERGVLDLNVDDPWANVAKIVEGWSSRYVAYDLIEANEAFTSPLVKRARSLVRFVYESAKPEEERAVAYRGAALEERRKELDGSLGPDDDIEVMKFADGLSLLYEVSRPVEGGRALGGVVIDQASFDAIFGGKSPKARATQIGRTSRVGDGEFRQALIDGGVDAVNASDDPAIELARAVESTASALRDYNAAQYAEPLRKEYSKIAKARFQVYGTDVYPDATFTLRLSYAKVAGYAEDDGTERPYQTTLGGVYAHAREHNCVDPYDLTQAWLDAEKEGRAPMDSPINFVSTNDIIGGNSGSPAVNAQGEIVGLVFDGNIQSLIANFTYDDVQARCVLVHSSGVRDAIRYIYQLPQLADELGK